jgi:ABC-type phosphate transport system substrate-binding protein
MTRTLRPRRPLLALAVSLTLASVLLALAAPRGEAAFSTTKCAGTDAAGRGASFANTAQTAWKLNFQGIFCADVGVFPSVTYDPAGSGAGLQAMGVRDATANPTGERKNPIRFAGTDDPPTPTQIQQMNQGLDAAGDEGIIHVVPAAVGAVAPLVNFPDGCDVDALPAGAKTAAQDLDNDKVDDDVVRVKFTKAQWEAIWAKDPAADQWDEVFPTLAGTPACQKPIIRVVRFDKSGTTFAFKDYLNKIDPGQGWTTTYESGNATAGNREWPNAKFGARADCAGASGPGMEDDAIDHLTSACANNATNLVAKLNATDGSVGYADVASARAGTPSLAISPEKNDNDTFWTQLQNGSGDFTEPTADPNGFREGGTKGANCTTTVFTGVPASTLDSWASVSGVNSPKGYGLCTLTYGLVFDDNADVYGASAEEEAKARTVKDYWTSIVSDGGQATLFPNDYAPLPASLLTISRAGVESIDWNKTGAAGGGGGGGGGGGTPTPPGKTTPTPPPAKPSNVFSVPSTTLNSKKGTATFSIRLPGGGQVAVKATSGKGKKRITVGSLRRTVSKAGTVKLTLTPGSAAKKALKKKGTLKVSVTITFTPQGGSAKSSTRTVTLKLAKPSKKAKR